MTIPTALICYKLFVLGGMQVNACTIELQVEYRWEAHEETQKKKEVEFQKEMGLLPAIMGEDRLHFVVTEAEDAADTVERKAKELGVSFGKRR